MQTQTDSWQLALGRSDCLFSWFVIVPPRVLCGIRSVSPLHLRRCCVVSALFLRCSCRACAMHMYLVPRGVPSGHRATCHLFLMHFTDPEFVTGNLLQAFEAFTDQEEINTKINVNINIGISL